MNLEVEIEVSSFQMKYADMTHTYRQLHHVTISHSSHHSLIPQLIYNEPTFWLETQTAGMRSSFIEGHTSEISFSTHQTQLETPNKRHTLTLQMSVVIASPYNLPSKTLCLFHCLIFIYFVLYVQSSSVKHYSWISENLSFSNFYESLQKLL